MTKYKNVSKIGSGGFGEVWECTRDKDKLRYAKKVLQDESTDAIARFKREVRLLACLDHPNIVKVVSRRLKTSPYFYVMPFFAHSLEEYSTANDIDEVEIENIFSRVLDGVSYAHQQGVIHRDLKPQNILLSSESDVVVSDFGLGRQMDSDSTRQTLTGEVFGTYVYMAPEQLKDSKSADERSEVYSLGKILARLYNGTTAFGPPDVTGIPGHVQKVIRRATKNDPNDRFVDATQLRDTWNQTIETLHEAAQHEDLESLISNLSAEPDSPEDVIEAFINAMLEQIEDEDAIHDAIMKVPASVFEQCIEQSYEDILLIFERFANNLTNQNWSFDYTDKIAKTCVQLHELLDFPDLRAVLAAAIAEVGVDHNRWFVMNQAANLFYLADEETGAFMVDRLSSLSERQLENLGGYISPNKLKEPLLQFFVPYVE